MKNTGKSENKEKEKRRCSGIDSGLALVLGVIAHSEKIRKHSVAAARIANLAALAYSAR